MVKKSKLLAALDAHKGRDFEAERQKKLRKLARRKQSSNEKPSGVERQKVNGLEHTEGGDQSEGWESDRSEKELTVPVCLFLHCH
jgi:rRNA-processing protein EBP2